VIDDAAHAVPLARALLAGGVAVIEVTLRTAAALDSLARIAREVPEMILAAGTVTDATQLRAVKDAGASVAISPGLTDGLLAASRDLAMPLLPGIATASELMRGMDAGLHRFKLFPASAVGGIALLQALNGPFPDARFCPTGGIGIDQAPDYLALPNVVCVGASWVASRGDITAGHWAAITANATRAAGLPR
jgi:2-dehydro-3-deoxyphosphogluconate aldolase / (4S)-4-hydroxy-2-oxoglutarate aldolase